VTHFVLLLAFFVTLGSARLHAQQWDAASATAVLYNQDVEESAALAAHYARTRGIPEDRLVGISVPDRDGLQRSEFEMKLRVPLLAEFTRRGWLPQNGPPPIKVLVTCRGLPFVIEPIPKGANNTAASVDSELAALGLPASANPSGAGSMKNPFYGKDEAFDTAGARGQFLVGRLDGPTWDIAHRLIDDAIETEKTGLWGFGYFDQWNSGRGGYGVGDQWIEEAFASARKAGIPSIVDRHRTRFVHHYPMRHAALYVGWYAWNADGPFVDPAFQFKRGAIAVHLHSYSAAHLRQTENEWTGPLLAKGACGVLGNVSEPYLGGTTHLDVFVDRLLKGYTLSEATWMATPGLSWMNVVVGDPLYRPFGPASQTGAGGPFREWKDAIRSSDPEAMKAIQDKAAASDTSHLLEEMLGLESLHENEPERAFEWLQQAAQNPADRDDGLRARLHAIDWIRRHAAEDQVLFELQKVLDALPPQDPTRIPVQSFIDQLDPPPPAPLTAVEVQGSSDHPRGPQLLEPSAGANPR